jgi:hypothetical protein
MHLCCTERQRDREMMPNRRTGASFVKRRSLCLCWRTHFGRGFSIRFQEGFFLCAWFVFFVPLPCFVRESWRRWDKLVASKAWTLDVRTGGERVKKWSSRTFVSDSRHLLRLLLPFLSLLSWFGDSFPLAWMSGAWFLTATEALRFLSNRELRIQHCFPSSLQVCARSAVCSLYHITIAFIPWDHVLLIFLSYDSYLSADIRLDIIGLQSVGFELQKAKFSNSMSVLRTSKRCC